MCVMVFLLATACKGRSKKTLVPFVWLLKKPPRFESLVETNLRENKSRRRELFSHLARGTSGGEQNIEPNGAAARRIRRPSKTLTTTAKTVSELGHSFSLVTHTHSPVQLCTGRDSGKISHRYREGREVSTTTTLARFMLGAPLCTSSKARRRPRSHHYSTRAGLV
uniref:Putative secreted protein n=1 Tax=Amblyomma cajennense TaxID=34607 RepID=A0A023FCR8_AMBCJ